MAVGDVKKASAATQERLRAYFREMNITDRLADDMMMIPTDTTKWLSPREIASYGLGVDDPVIKETNAIKRAQKYGLSRIEYELRWKRVQEICDDLSSPPDCEDKIMREVRPAR